MPPSVSSLTSLSISKSFSRFSNASSNTMMTTNPTSSTSGHTSKHMSSSSHSHSHPSLPTTTTTTTTTSTKTTTTTSSSFASSLPSTTTSTANLKSTSSTPSSMSYSYTNPTPSLNSTLGTSSMTLSHTLDFYSTLLSAGVYYLWHQTPLPATTHECSMLYGLSLTQWIRQFLISTKLPMEQFFLALKWIQLLSNRFSKLTKSSKPGSELRYFFFYSINETLFVWLLSSFFFLFFTHLFEKRIICGNLLSIKVVVVKELE
ncbi:hypothetical protein HMI54_003794 [Coelomomyces lativittatus]|nr:hypothetical protein HMI54_003794 [Coelomomyces lativittatus]